MIAPRRVPTLAYRALQIRYASTASKAPTTPVAPRKPIIITGAGPAGLALAHVLKAGRVPFEICEKFHYNESLDRSRRGHRIDLDWGVLELVSRLLNLSTRGILRFCAPPGFIWSRGRQNDISDLRHNLDLAKFVKLMAKKLDVRYGCFLYEEGISFEGDTVTPRFSAEQSISTAEGSMIVGADGLFSAVRQATSQTGSVVEFLFASPILSLSAGMLVPRDHFESVIAPQIGVTGRSSVVIGHTNLEIHVISVLKDKVHLRLSFSRSAEDYLDYSKFYRVPIDKRDTPYTEYEFDKSVSKEISELGPLPPLFDYLFSMVSTKHSLCQRRHPISVKIPEQQLPTRVAQHNVTAPAVLIGDAASSLPWGMLDDSINNAILDGVQLGRLIVERFYDSDQKLFCQIPADFYKRASPRWEEARENWVKAWQKNHNEVEGENWGAPLAVDRWVQITGLQRRNKLQPPERFESVYDALVNHPDAGMEHYLQWWHARQEALYQHRGVKSILRHITPKRTRETVAADGKETEETEEGSLVIRFAEMDTYGALKDRRGEFITPEKAKKQVAEVRAKAKAAAKEATTESEPPQLRTIPKEIPEATTD